MNEQRHTNRLAPVQGSGAGFTLVEIMIAITVASVLGAAILSLVLGQNRFYGQSDDTIYAQQSLRAAMDMIASELRMAGSGDVIAAEADSVVVRFDLERAVVCLDDPSNDRVYLYVYDRVGNANVPSGFRGAAFSSPYDTDWTYGDSWTGTSETSSQALTACDANGAPNSDPASSYRRVAGWGAKFGTVPEKGSLIRFYGKLTYKLAPSSFTDGLAIWRNGQELVSPFEDGAAFSYELSNGLTLSSVPVTDLLKVETIKVDVTAVGDGPNRFDVRRSIEYDIPLRN